MVPTLAALKFICSRFSIRLVWVNTGSGLCSSQFRFFQVQYSLELLYRLLLKRILQLNFVKSQRFFKKYVEQSNAQYESGLNLLIPCRNFYFLFLTKSTAEFLYFKSPYIIPVPMNWVYFWKLFKSINL